MCTWAPCLAKVAFGIALAGFPLMLLSYAWLLVPTSADEPALRYAIVVGEVGALLAAIAAISLSLAVRRHFHDATAERRKATHALLLGTLLLSLVILPNVIGILWSHSP